MQNNNFCIECMRNMYACTCQNIHLLTGTLHGDCQPTENKTLVYTICTHTVHAAIACNSDQKVSRQIAMSA